MPGRSIRLFLIDGTPQGMRTAEVGNWTGLALVCPRTDNAYLVNATTETAYIGGFARVLYAPNDPSVNGGATSGGRHVVLSLGDHLGSTVALIDHGTGELVEAPSYAAYGATESDYRPARWGALREAYRFTGKEDETAVGLTYFGARYYHPLLGRWISADPLTIHGVAGDLNPYAYVGGRVHAATDPLGLDACLGKETVCGNGNGNGNDPTQVGSGGSDPVGRAVVDVVHEIESWFGGGGSSSRAAPSPPPPTPIACNCGVASSPYNAWANAGSFDRWLNTSEGWLAGALRDDQLLSTVQNGFAAIAITAGTIATGGIAAGAAGITVDGALATAGVWTGRAAQAITMLSLAEQGIVVGGGGAGAMYMGERALGSGAARMEMRAIQATTAINLPAWKGVGIDMAHILERHVPGAPLGAGRTVFPAHMSEKAIESAVRQAYRVGQKISAQGDRALIRGQVDGMTIEMWVNKATQMIETAYPVF